MTLVDWPIPKVLVNLDFLQTLLLSNLETRPLSALSPAPFTLSYQVTRDPCFAEFSGRAFLHLLLNDIVEHCLPETPSYLASGTFLSLVSPLPEVGLLGLKADAS